jgi:DNA-binding CsgD family transcriptional regulator
MDGSAELQLLERETELNAFRAAFEGIRSGRGRPIVLEGAAGTGKSALTQAACELADRAGLRVLRARGGELEQEYAFGVMRQLFERVVATARPSERDRLLAGAAAPAQWVLAPEPSGPSDRAAAGFAVLNSLYWLALNLTADRPLLLVLDDAHWADASSLRALNFLVARATDASFGVIAAYRTAEPGVPTAILDELRTHPNAHRLTVGPLGEGSVTRIVRDRFPGADDSFCEACHASSGGNPLYLEELLRTLAGNGLLTHPDPAALVREASVPSLGQRVGRRIAGLAGDAPALTTAMAVLGDGARLAAAAELAEVELTIAGEVAHQLRRIDVLASEDPIVFTHPLVRRSVYDAQTETDRQRAHAGAAALLRDAGAPAEAVAAHLAVVPPAGSSAVAAALFEAGQSALSRAAPDEAIRWFQRARSEQAPEPPEAAILMQMGMTGFALRDPEAIGHLREALERSTDVRERTQIAVALGDILGHAGQWEEALAVADRAEREVADVPELATEVAALRAVIEAYDPAFVEDFDRALPRYRELAQRDEWGAHALAALLAAILASRGAPASEVLALADRALAGGRLLAERVGSWPAGQLLGALVEVEALDRALEVGREVAEIGEREGAPGAGLIDICFRAWVHAKRGDLASAEAELRTVLDVAAAAEMAMVVLSPIYFTQDAILERPSLDDAAALVETVELDPVFRRTWTGGMLLHVRGRLRLARQDPEAGIADLREAGRIATALKFGPVFSGWRPALALALRPADREEALALAAEDLALARATEFARPQGVALRTLGMLESGEGGIELLRESVALLENTDARLEHARTLVELGAAMRRRHRRAEARPELQAGMELAHHCGAQRLADRAKQELRAAGSRPRRMARSGREALTASELRVAGLAADGATNPQIAQELYVSLKTVETHLSHAYAKLGLSGQGSRARLARALKDSAGETPDAAVAHTRSTAS